MCTGLEIAAIAGLALSVAGTAYQATQGAPDLPEVKPPLPPPAPPPTPQPVPPPLTETQVGEGVARERRRRQQRFGVQQTLLSSPLGGGADLRAGSTAGRSLLGG